jgi:exodeoxyribonuclease V alpha subunit
MSSYERIQGNIKRVIFQNEDNPFYVLLVNTEDDQIVVAGNLPNFKNEDTKYGYEFSGEFVEHAKYGLQFKALEANLVMPSQAENIIDFLSNSNFKGIGKKTAQNIYELYDSENVLDDILLNAEPLLTLKGIDENKVAIS